MFQKFITCLSDNSYISYMGLCMRFIFIKINYFFVLDPVLPVVSMQIFDLKKQLHSYNIFFVMIVNLYLSSA